MQERIIKTHCICGEALVEEPVLASWIDGTDYDPPVEIIGLKCAAHGTIQHLIPDGIEYSQTRLVTFSSVSGPQLWGKKK